MIELALSFVAVVKANNYSEAARKTGISKAKLSRHVKKLEQQLGSQLLHRTTRSLVLTEAGKQFFESCRLIEEHYDEAVENLKNDFSAIQGSLKITAPIDFGIEFLPQILHEFTERYPKINISLSLSNMNENLVENNYHLAFRIANQLADSSLRMLTIKEFKRVICATPDYFKNKKLPKILTDLKNHRCITSVNHNANAVNPQWAFYKNKQIINLPLSNVIKADSLLVQKQLISLGAGIGRMPDYLIQNELDTGKFIEILPTINKPSSYIYLLYSDKAFLPKKIRAFIDFIKEKIKEDNFPHVNY